MWRPSRSELTAALCVGIALVATRSDAGPELDYILNCAGCHRSDGAGTPGSVPALAGSVARFVAVPGGREYLVQVPGVATSALDDAALAAVLNWVLESFDREHLPADFARYSAEEVGRLRKAPLTNVERVRRELLATIERQK